MIEVGFGGISEAPVAPRLWLGCCMVSHTERAAWQTPMPIAWLGRAENIETARILMREEFKNSPIGKTVGSNGWHFSNVHVRDVAEPV